MSIRKSHDEFVKEANTKHPHIEIIGIYVSANSPIEFKCTKHNHTFRLTPSSFIRSKHGCSLCAAEYVGKCSKLSNEQFLDLLKEKSPNILPLEEYVKSNSQILVECSICGHRWKSTPNYLLQGKSGCKHCAMMSLHKNNLKSHDSFVDEVKTNNIHHNTFDVVGNYSCVDNPVLCKCKLCGNEWSPRAGHLLSSNCACPICRISKGEMTIKQYLENRKIDFVCQKSFDGLIGVRNGSLRYDFYIPSKNLLIEYQGEFHDGTVVYQSKKEYEIRKEHDKRKKQYAKDNNIGLLEIWYWDFNKIEQILDKIL